MPPFWQYFLRLLARGGSPSRTPKDANHGHPRTFPCITAVFGDRWEGPSSPSWTPGKPTPYGGRRPGPRRGSTCSGRERKGRRAHLCPQKGANRRPCRLFPAKPPFLGATEGADDPPSWTPSHAGAVMGAKAMAPSWQYLCLPLKEPFFHTRKKYCHKRGHGPRPPSGRRLGGRAAITGGAGYERR
jgi:hypothetical protein